MDLFDIKPGKASSNLTPLAYRMRPRTLDEVQGQKAVAPGSVLRRAIEKDQLQSFVLFGPPGTGKTSIARIIAKLTNAHFELLPAVTSGVNDIKKIAAAASERIKYYGQRTIVFVDEIHRFNKSQQDVLLPFVEDGTLLLVGATTENPLYELNNALLSRMKLFILDALQEEDIAQIIKTALNDTERGLGEMNVTIDKESLVLIARTCKGDARMALNILETAVNSYLEKDSLNINTEILQSIITHPLLKYDRSGDYHYDTISAFIKSIRGSEPDAALYWLAVMLEGGEDPKFIVRRLIVHAAEDIGLADPYALSLATAAASAVEFIGMPEARIPLAEATIYLATAPKSNSSKLAIDEAISAVRKSSKITVPAHIADSSHSRSASLLGKGKGYKYPHDYGGYIQQKYLPDEIAGICFYHPGTNGYEKKIQTFLEQLSQKINPG